MSSVVVMRVDEFAADVSSALAMVCFDRLRGNEVDDVLSPDESSSGGKSS